MSTTITAASVAAFLARLADELPDHTPSSPEELEERKNARHAMTVAMRAHRRRVERNKHSISPQSGHCC